MSFPSSGESFSSQLKIPVKRYTLKNGLKVLLNPDPKTTIASYYLGFATGSRHERLGLTGISHMFEHLMFKGTKKYPDIMKLYSEHGIVGTNAMTSKDYTVYYADFLSDKLDLILDAESDRMSNLTLTQNDLDKERQAVQEERRLRVDNQPRGMLFESLFETVFKIHSYYWPVLGYKKDIDAYTLEELNLWYRTYYSPNNATLVLSGNFSEAKAQDLIQKYFGHLSSKAIPQEKVMVELPQVKARSHSIEKSVQTKQAFLSYRLPGNRNKEILALEVACDLLGSGESSRLYKKLVREKKITSSISCFIMNMKQHSVFSVYYSIPKDSSEKKVKELIYDEIHQMISEDMKKREMEKIKNMKLMSFIEQLKRSSSKAHLLGLYELNFNGYENIYKDLDKIGSISSDFIQETMKKYLKPNQSSYLILRPKTH